MFNKLDILQHKKDGILRLEQEAMVFWH
jgi:hypothetical protein